MTSYSCYTDHELLQFLSEDNQQAFDELYTRHWEEMFKTAFVILRDTDSCKDIVQDIFVWLWEHRHSLDVQHCRSYLKASVKFKVANYIRSGNIHENVVKQLASITPLFNIASTDESVELKQLIVIVAEAVSDLPPKCRQIFQLSREQQMSNKEIAEQLNISVKTVENQMTIALRKVKQATQAHITTLIPGLLSFILF